MASDNSAPTKTAMGNIPSEEAKTASKSNGSSQRKIPQSKPRIRSKEQPEGDSLLDFNVPRRVSGGKVNPTHMFLVLGVVMLGMLNMAYKMSNMFVPPKGKTYKRITKALVNRHEDRRETIKRSILDPLIELILQEDPEAFKAIDPCGLYLGQSSIPDSGWGFFAGKNYTLGGSIRVDHGQNIPSSVSGSEILSPWSLLLKPHSVLSNVKLEAASDGTMLVATRDIVGGEELFLSWEDHPVSGNLAYIFAHSIPTSEHFLRADDHIRDARTQYFGAINYTKIEKGEEIRNRRNHAQTYSNARFNRAFNMKKEGAPEKLYKKEAAKDIEKGLRLWQSAVQSYDPQVAKLLPTKAAALAKYHRKTVEDRSLFSSSSSLLSLNNQTIRSLSKSATCVSNLEWQPVTETKDPSNAEESCSSEYRFNQVVTRERGFAKGEILGVVPLLATQQIGGEECILASKDVALCPLGGIQEQSSDATLANVRYRWSNSTVKSLFSGEDSFLSFSSEEQQRHKEILLKESPLSISWDIVALRDIEHNEPVILYGSCNNLPL
eukprot:CAMPEP_0116154210 /NCGR_PEP_ID=MMETSP0329-20121206/21658_1 /TAXON_ID=697910 /ORGANISM="Pseudo-nitzschia arenysensis, Strain B593" /LENGTH=548 /DNA_ID=CAMNT_0003651173 /DNA_START=25 /DNA_END=1671 /DNA_ORIENTATION=-